MKFRQAAILLVIVVAGIGVGGVVFGNADIPLLSSAMPGDNGGNGDTGGNVEMVSTGTFEVDGKIALPTSIGTGEVVLFTDKPETGAPTHHDDYVDFSLSEAKQGLTEGVDYHQVSLSNSDTATFSDLDAGEYHAVLVDESSPRDYHYEFFTVSMPEQVEKFRVEQSQPVTLADEGNFTRFPTYDEDYTEVFKPGSDSPTALASDLDDPSSDVVDRERTVTRTVTLTGGSPYLGELRVENLNANEGISQIDVTVTSDGEVLHEKTLLSGSTDEFGSDNNYAAAIVDAPQEDPNTPVDTATVSLDVTYNANETGTVQDGNDYVETGESMFDFGVEDIYGNVIGNSGMVTLTG